MATETTIGAYEHSTKLLNKQLEPLFELGGYGHSSPDARVVIRAGRRQLRAVGSGAAATEGEVPSLLSALGGVGSVHNWPQISQRPSGLSGPRASLATDRQRFSP